MEIKILQSFLLLIFIGLLFTTLLNYNTIESQLEEKQQQDLETQTVKDVERDWYNLVLGKKSLNGGPAWDIQEL